MELTTFCKQAQEGIEEVMSYDDGFHSLEDMDFLTLMAKHYFCTNLAMEKIWGDYRQITTGNEPKPMAKAPVHNHSHKLTDSEIHEWVHSFENADGTTGEHWTIEQTTAVGEAHNIDFNKIDKHLVYATMNMLYSDYCVVAKKYNVNTADFYMDMTKAFLLDVDSVMPTEKLYFYHEYISK